jgi:DNA-binding transcriptional LysR family regulator
VFPGLELKFFRGTAAEIADHLKRGESELALAGPLGTGWDRLDAWPLFEEGYALVVNRTHALALRNALEFSDIARLRMLSRPYCEQAAEVSAALKAEGIDEKTGDHILSDHDLIALLRANLGASIMPESAAGDGDLRLLPIGGLTLRRAVSLYAVAGRERTPAAAALMKLLRAADWSEPRAARSVPASA